MTDPMNSGQIRVSEQIYRKLRKAIMVGELPSRMRLVETELAARLEVSRTPVREAIARLINEQIVIPLPHGGVEVADVTHELEDIFSIREALEGTAARLAAERMTPEEVAELERILASHWALPTDDYESRTAHNNAFHGAILQAARAPRLVRLVEDYRDFFVQASQLPHYQKRHTQKALQQHEEILAAIKAGDGKRAEKLTRLHLNLGMQRMLEQRSKLRFSPLSL